jgi:1-deoxy-D-xylulose-5-phosphate reductoisomerase
LRPTFEAVCAGKDIALANKETLVAAGALITREAQRSKVRLIPVDSEHSAVFQCLQGVRRSELKRIILTASGGPFHGQQRELLAKVTPEEAVAHPRWDMGKKISVDSATLMNKGLEVIEARWLFEVPVDRIDVVVHPQSIVHSLVELIDGAVLAQLNLPDMRHPIQYALTYPQRLPAPALEPLKLTGIGQLTFAEPDLETFECLQLALTAARVGGTMPAVMNAANEAAVAAFLDTKISFLEIAALVRQTMEAHTFTADPELESVLSADGWARKHVQQRIAGGGP